MSGTETVSIEQMRGVVEGAKARMETDNVAKANIAAVKLSSLAAAAAFVALTMEARQPRVLEDAIGAAMYSNPELKRTPAETQVKASPEFIAYRERKAAFETLAEEARGLSRYFHNRTRALLQGAATMETA
jgi:hypothetical protein